MVKFEFRTEKPVCGVKSGMFLKIAASVYIMLSCYGGVCVAELQKIFVAPEEAEAHLTHRVEPVCPADGKLARVQGDVVLRVVINSSGNVEEIHKVSGNPMLISSAIEAVSQWTYKPFLSQGKPVGAQTTVTIHYRSCL